MILPKDGRPGGRIRWLQPKRPVGTVAVVLLAVDPQDLLEMASADDQQPVRALGADRADPPFRVGVRLGCSDRCHQHFPTL